MRSTADAVVIGGGLYGTAIAWHLARLGAGSVVLVEKNGIASGATGRSSANVQFNYSVELLAQIGAKAREYFDNYSELTGGGSGFRRTGMLVLHTPDDAATAARNVGMLQRSGIEMTLIDASEVRKYEPGISIEGVGAAFWEERAGYADPVLTANSYADAGRRAGVEMRLDTQVVEIWATGGAVSGVATGQSFISSPMVVVAAGYRTAELVRPLGVDVPLRPERHTLAVIKRGAGYRGIHPIVADRPNGTYFRPDGSELTLVGSHLAQFTSDDPEVENHRRPEPSVEAGLAAQFLKRYPGEDGAELRRGYTGVYDCSPDNQFILGPVRAVGGLHIACGFSGHGFKFSPVVSELVAERAVTGGNREFDITPFRLERFAEGQPIRPEFPYRHQKL